MMNLIICLTTVVFLLSTGSVSRSETPPGVLNVSVTTPASNLVDSQPDDNSHEVSEVDSKEADDDDDDDDDDGDDDPNNDDDSPDDENYRNPRTHPEECHIGAEPAWLCNEDDVLDKEIAMDLNELLESMVDAKGICPCSDVSCSYTGFPMTVVVLDKIPDYINKSEEDQERHIDHLAESFLHDWDFNTCNDGAVTVVVKDKGTFVTVIDRASEYLVPDDCQEFVENAVSSFFDEGHIAEGLTKLIQEYRSIVLKNHSCNSDSHLKKSVIIPIILIIALIIVAAIVAAVVAIYRRRRSKNIRTEANVPLKDQHQPQKA